MLQHANDKAEDVTSLEDWRNEDTDRLCEALLSLETLDEAAQFLRDLCTRRELNEMAHRWAVARLLDRGLPYREIADQVGASTATVTRINEWLHHGMGGYRLVLDRLGAGPP
jgi:TrpR-related protein YerC/YecD